MKYTELGRRLRTARLEKGLSQKKLADLLGCQRQRIILWEKGANQPNPKYRRQLTIRLNVSDFSEDEQPMTDAEAGADERTQERYEERMTA